MGCLFCGIADGTIPAHTVYRDELVVAFLDLYPIRPGHTQIVPVAHYPYFEHLPEEVATRMFSVGQRLAKAMKRIYGVERVAYAFSGGDIAHAHAHCFPIHGVGDMTSARYIAETKLTFQRPATPPADELVATTRVLADALTGA